MSGLSGEISFAGIETGGDKSFLPDLNITIGAGGEICCRAASGGRRDESFNFFV